MKSYLSSLLLLFLSLAAWAQEFNDGNFHYSVTDAENFYVSVSQNSDNAPTGAVVIPSSVIYNEVTYTVTSIADYGFYYNTGISGVTLPNTLTSIGDLAFVVCSSLASFSVPSSVTTIGSDVFDGCSIPSFTFEASNTAITCNTEIPCTDHLYLYRDITQGGEDPWPLTNSIKSLTIGANVTTINDFMFQGCYYLSSIDFSAATGLTSIGSYAFSGCGTFVPEPEEDPVPNLTTIDLSNTKVTSIGESAFSSCTKLETITLPSTLTSIGNYAFSWCSSLASFSVPASVTTIGYQVFYDCSIPTFTFEASNTAITCNAAIPCTDHLFLYRDVGGYELATGAIKALTIGANVTTINANMFVGCHYLSSIDFSEATGLTSIGSYAFYDCGNYVPTEPGEDPVPNLTAIDLSNTKVTSIGQNAFNSCYKLETITLPSTLTSIGNYAFKDCRSLVSFSVPSSVTTIGSDVFDGCSIPSFTFEASNTAITCSTTIPCTNLYLYRDVDRGGYGLATLAIKALTIGANVTTINENMFLGCHYLSSIDFSAATGLTSIGNYAFYGCGNYVPTEPGEDPVPNLTAIDLSNTKVTSIGKNAFYSCYKLETITLPSTLTSIGNYAFQDCSSLTSFSVPGSVTTIGSDVFDGCSIPSFTFEASNTAITCSTTIPCTNLYLGRDITFTENGFSGVSALTIGTNVTSIGSLFLYINITSVTVPWDSPITIADDAFSDDTYANATLWIPGGTKAAYEAADGWKNFTNKDFSSFVVSITGSAHGTLAVGDIESTGGVEQTTLIDRETDVVFTVTPETGYETTTFTVNGEAASLTDNSYTVENLSADQTVVANFTAISYTIGYDLAGGSVASANPTAYTIESSNITLNNPTQEGYTFAGWTGTDLAEATTSVTIAAGSTGNRSYTATWTKKTYSVTITGGGVTADNTKPEYGDNVVLTIMDDPDAELISLTVNGDDVTSSIVENHYTISGVTGNITVVATWNSTKEFITLGSDIATFSCTEDLNFTGSELKSYIAAGFSKDGGTVLLVRVYDVPANTGLVIKGTQGDTYKIPYSTSMSYFVNLLKPHTTADAVPVTVGDYTNFILQKSGDDYIWNHKTEGTMSLGAKRAYLQLPTDFLPDSGSNVRQMSMIFEDELTPTEIRDNYILLQESKYNGRIYNVSGQQIETLQKGVNIVNGLKILK